jgi:hypothetical protein
VSERQVVWACWHSADGLPQPAQLVVATSDERSAAVYYVETTDAARCEWHREKLDPVVVYVTPLNVACWIGNLHKFRVSGVRLGDGLATQRHWVFQAEEMKE